MSQATIRARVDFISKVPPEIVSQTAASDRDLCIADALTRYNQDRPRRLTKVIAAVGGSTWEYSLSANITGWNPSQYSIDQEGVEYPGGKQSSPRLDDNDWGVHRKADGAYWLRFLRNNPASGNDIWIHYTTPHTIDGTTETITADHPNDVDAFCHLAASLVLREAANYYTRIAASSIGQDVIDYRSMSGEAKRRADDELAIYEDHIKAERGGQSAFLDWDTQVQDGRDFLFWPSNQS